ncbi:MAG: hypothetical protein PHY09_11315 [Desulfuromonadaceae bacterium]|nr:hypothetical protein [Desulfuromonadaceae bacterium]MDD5106123.1 hypothetical protein [Desulfuromonadaceae bacterium]
MEAFFVDLHIHQSPSGPFLFLGAHRDEIGEELLNHLNEDQQEEWEESAAIMECDGKLQRDHAECLVLLDFRISGNSNSGLFCKDWISVVEIQNILKDVAKPATSTLRHLYAGKSSNSPGFLLSCLFNAKIAVKDNSTADPALEAPPEKKPASKKATSKADGD